MSGIRLHKGQHIEVCGHDYEFVRSEDGKKQFVNSKTGALVWLKEEELVVRFDSGEARLAPDPMTPACRHDNLRQDFASMPEKTKQRARRRKDYADALLENADRGCPRRPGDVLRTVSNRRKETPPGLSTAYYWAKVWDLAGRRDIRHLVFAENNRGARGLRCDKETAKIIKRALQDHLTPNRRRAKNLHDKVETECKEAGLEAVSQRTIRRVLAAQSPSMVMRARRGKRAADLKYAMVSHGPISAFPGEVLEIDAHQLNVIVVDGRIGLPLGRPWVTTAIDRCTRMIVGFHLSIEPPSSLTIAACIRNAIAPKNYMLARWPYIGREWPCWGVPCLAVVDNALENKAEFLLEAAEEIGFHIHFAPPRTPEYKAKIERWHGTLGMNFSDLLPGATGSSPQDRGDLDSAGLATLTLSQLDELLHQYVVTCYNRDFHTGITDIPERLWLAKTQDWEAVPFSDIQSLDTLLGCLAWRVPSAKGIELAGLLYNSPIIELIRTRAGAADLKKVKVRFDPTDLSCIWVLDPKTLRYETIPAVDPEGYTQGLTLAQHRVIRRYAVERARGYVTVKELCLARHALVMRIQEIMGDSKAKGRMKAARLEGEGAKGSFGDFYRLAEDAYADGPIIDVLSVEVPSDNPKSPPKQLPAPAKAKSARAPRKPKAEAKPELVPGEVPTAPLPLPVAEEDFHARAKRLNINVEGI